MFTFSERSVHIAGIRTWHDPFRVPDNSFGTGLAELSPIYVKLITEMRNPSIFIVGILALALCLCAQKQNTPPEGIAPRATPTDYQFHAQADKLTVAAEFTGHSVGTPEGTLTTEDYVVIETAVYGPPGARTKLSAGDFSLRVNGKKPVTGQPYGLVANTLRDLELEPTASEQKSKTSTTGSGGQSDFGSKPEPYRVPDALRHDWRQRLQKASLPEGDRALPQAGLIYFLYHGKTEKIQSIELTYTGPAGQFTLALHP